MIKNILLYFALLVWFVVPIQAQPTIFSQDITADPGEIISMPISLSGFNDNIAGIQFTIIWDQNILEYVELKDEFFEDNNFSFAAPISSVTGNLRVIAFDGSNELLGASFSDTVHIVTVMFKVIGTKGTMTDFVFGTDTVSADQTFDLLFSTPDDKEIEISPVVNIVKIRGENAVENINSLGVQIGQNVPNPFVDKTYIPIQLDQSGDVKLTILDINGKEIYKQHKNITKGKTNLELDSSIFKSSGIYFYRVETFDYTNTRKLFFKQ